MHRRRKAAEWARYVSPNLYAVVTLTVVPLVLACARPSPPPRSRFATLPAISAEIADSLQRIELARVPDVEARALLTSQDAAVRIRAALAVGRIGDAEAAGALRRMLPQARVLRLLTSRGEMVIDLRPDIAPLTTSALAALANRGFYNGLTFHRVVPDFVVQGGDPRGDGDGGPGWALPDEHSPLPFLHGTLGIATSGPETGGSQFFLCHSPQPHLDGRYTGAGQLRSGDEVLDALQPGDTILSASAE